ncbi:MAG: hypothetical protein IJZ19_09695 [Lentisphaeria bacterium]|nr:hypothetical protein [Lentisphaeria bacterium]
MMKYSEKPILIQEYNGDRVPFDAEELQRDLIGSFLSAGKQELAYLAGEIALAVEYTMLNSSRPELVFGRGEVGAAVIRMLEETGFPEVASCYRNSCGECYLTLTPEFPVLAELLKKYLASPAERFNDVVANVCKALKNLNITAVPLHLALELARYYEHLAAEQHRPEELKKQERKLQKTVRQADIYNVLPSAAAPLIEAEILRVNSISAFFPCIRFVFELEKFARQQNYCTPVMEMELVGPLFEVGQLLDLCRKSIDEAFSPQEPLPVSLHIPDMSDFVVFFLGGERMRFQRAGRDAAKMITAGFSGELYKLTLS